jgi:RNA polymerase sigma factor (sigma-70 family)
MTTNTNSIQGHGKVEADFLKNLAKEDKLFFEFYDSRDEDIFAEWMQLVIRRVALIIKRVATEATLEDVEDATAELFLYLYRRAIENYNPHRSSPSGFLTSLAIYKGRELRRSLLRQKLNTSNSVCQNKFTDNIDEGEISVDSLASKNSQLEDDVLARESLKELLDTLTQVERKTLELRWEGYSYDEIANRVGKTSNNIRQLVFRMRRKVKPAIGSSVM